METPFTVKAKPGTDVWKQPPSTDVFTGLFSLQPLTHTNYPAITSLTRQTNIIIDRIQTNKNRPLHLSLHRSPKALHLRNSHFPRTLRSPIRPSLSSPHFHQACRPRYPQEMDQDGHRAVQWATTLLNCNMRLVGRLERWGGRTQGYSWYQEWWEERYY